MYPEHLIHRMIKEPVYHGIDLSIPEQLGNQDLAELGYVDVTAAPFFADSSGEKDSTEAIQEAINLARDSQMVCYLPKGTYLIADTLECIQNYYYWREDKPMGARHHPCVLFGSHDLANRPTLKLPEQTKGFESIDSPKFMIHFWARACGQPWVNGKAVAKLVPEEKQPNISMNQLFMGMNIEIGKGNSGAVAICHQGAEGSGVHDVFIDARYGYKGIEGGAGSGGGHFNVHVLGGRIGLDFAGGQPAGATSGMKLEEQTEGCLIYDGKTTLSVVGCEFRPEPGAFAIKSTVGPEQKLPFFGHMVIVDSTIEYPTPAAATAISSYQNLVLNNVYIKHAEKCLSSSGNLRVKHQGAEWLCIKEFAEGRAPGSIKDNKYTLTYPVYVNHNEHPFILETLEEDPPDNICSQHAWGQCPDFTSPKVTNVKQAPYHAKGDGVADDSSAIQKAIDENDDIFIPKGHYRVTRPLKLRPTSRIVGIHPLFSNMFANEANECFADRNNPQPVLSTPNTAQAENYLALFSVSIPRKLQEAVTFHHQSGNATIRNCRFGFHHERDDEAKGIRDVEWVHPLVIASENAGGKWYLHYEEQPIKGADYRLVLLKDLRNGLRFYHLDTVHGWCDAQTEIDNCKNVTIYGYKTERNSVVMRINNSSNIKVLGYGGNATAFPGECLMEINNCENITLASLVDLGRIGGNGVDSVFGLGFPPDEWNFLVEKSKHGDFKTPPCERPAYYRIDF